MAVDLMHFTVRRALVEQALHFVNNILVEVCGQHMAHFDPTTRAALMGLTRGLADTQDQVRFASTPPPEKS